MGYPGGNNQSTGEKQRRVMQTLRPLTPIDMGWRFQCRCGKTLYARYQGRYYCWTCGRRWEQGMLESKIFGKSFSETYKENER